MSAIPLPMPDPWLEYAVLTALLGSACVSRFRNPVLAWRTGLVFTGIGMVSARIAEMVLRDERAVIPVGSFQKRFGVTLSLPSVVGRDGVVQVLEPALADDERAGLEKSAATLRKALARVRK